MNSKILLKFEGRIVVEVKWNIRLPQMIGMCENQKKKRLDTSYWLFEIVTCFARFKKQ